MAKRLIKQLSEYVSLYRDDRTGIAWVEDGSTGNGHSAHPNIHWTGSVQGMIRQGYWESNARVVRSNGYWYNTDICTIHDELDQVAADYCQCGGKHTNPHVAKGHAP